ncbi:MAG: helix-turn-helix domain-containing protein [Butyricicoccus sp.]|jgi:putative transcriptional regulator
MKVTYKKLWVLCAEREISKAELRKRAGLSSATFTKLRKNQEVNLSVLLENCHCYGLQRGRNDGFYQR